MSRFWAANESSEDDSSSDDSSVSSSSSEDNKKGAGGNNKWLEFSDDSGKSFSSPLTLYQSLQSYSLDSRHTAPFFHSCNRLGGRSKSCKIGKNKDL